MIRENQQLFNLLNVIFDVVVLLISVSIICSFSIPSLSFHSFNLSNKIPLEFFIYLIPSYLFLYYELKLYRPQRTNKSIFSESSKILEVNFIEYLFLSVLSTLGIIDISADFLILFLIINSILATIERALVRLILRYMRSHNFNIKYILVVGAGQYGRHFVETIKKNPYLGYKVIGFLDDNVEGTVSEIEVLGKLNDLEDILESHIVDRVVVSIAPHHYKKFGEVTYLCEKMGVRVDIIPDYYRYITSHPSIELIDNIPLISVRYLPLDISYNNYIKRIFDIVFVSVVSVIISPILILVAIGIKLTSPGPIIYKQKRVGRDGEVFKMYKFRSMYVNDEESTYKNIHWTRKDDPRITPIGRFIRKFSIDELPQFYNILRGDMSLIGPRPERPYLVNKFRESVPKYMIKHHVRPGMTGWAQIHGYRGNTSIVKRIQHDIYYVENWSVMMDVKIFIKTLGLLLTDKNAY